MKKAEMRAPLGRRMRFGRDCARLRHEISYRGFPLRARYTTICSGRAAKRPGKKETNAQV